MNSRTSAVAYSTAAEERVWDARKIIAMRLRDMGPKRFSRYSYIEATPLLKKKGRKNATTMKITSG
jgi:hypothetical protein